MARRDAEESRKHWERLISDRASLCKLALLYGCIVRVRHAPSFLTELHLLSRMLSVHPEVGGGPTATPPALFSTGADCVLFAAHVLDDMRFSLLHLGSLKLLRRLTEHPAVHVFVPKLARLAQRELEHQEDLLLGGHGRGSHSIEMDDLQPQPPVVSQRLDVFESLRRGSGGSVVSVSAGASPPGSTAWSSLSSSSSASASASYTSALGAAGVGLSFALPFRPDTDSRSHFRGKELSAVYKNRQEATDAFLGLLREFTQLQHTVDNQPALRFDRELPARARACLAALMPCNMAWFSRFFLTQLIQNSLMVMGSAGGGSGRGAMQSGPATATAARMGAFSSALAGAAGASGGCSGGGDASGGQTLSGLSPHRLVRSDSIDSTRSSLSTISLGDEASSATTAAVAERRLRLLSMRMSSSGMGSSNAHTSSKRLGVRHHTKGRRGGGGRGKARGGPSGSGQRGHSAGKGTAGNGSNNGAHNQPKQPHKKKNRRGNGGGGARNSTHKKHNAKMERQKAEQHAANVRESVSTGAAEIENMFPKPLQRFFVTFLRATDSHRLFQHCRALCVATLDKLCRRSVRRHADNPEAAQRGGKEAEEDDEDDNSNNKGGAVLELGGGTGASSLTDILLQARVVGRLLGYILYSHNWPTGLNAVYSMGSLPFDNELDAATAATNRGDPMFDVLSRLRTAWAEGGLLLVVPWLVELLSMSAFDAVTLRSAYFEAVIALLRRVRADPGRWCGGGGERADAGGGRGGGAGSVEDPTLTSPSTSPPKMQWTSTCSFVSMQVEKLFQDLDLPIDVGANETAGGGGGMDNPSERRTLRRPSGGHAAWGVRMGGSSCIDVVPRLVTDRLMTTCNPMLGHVLRILVVGRDQLAYHRRPHAQWSVGAGSGSRQTTPLASGGRQQLTPKTLDSGQRGSAGHKRAHTARKIRPVNLAPTTALMRQQQKQLRQRQSSVVVATSLSLSRTANPSGIESISSGQTRQQLTQQLNKKPNKENKKGKKGSSASTLSLLRQEKEKKSGRVLLRQRLSETFFRQHPQQMKLCDFAIDAVVQNAIDYAVSRSVLPSAEAMVEAMRVLLSVSRSDVSHAQPFPREKGAGGGRGGGGGSQATPALPPRHRQGPSRKVTTAAKARQLDLFTSSREQASANAHTHAVRYVQQFAPRIVLSVAPSSMVQVREEPSTGKLSLEPARGEADGTALRAALPLIVDLASSLVEKRLPAMVKRVFRERIEEFQRAHKAGERSRRGDMVSTAAKAPKATASTAETVATAGVGVAEVMDRVKDGTGAVVAAAKGVVVAAPRKAAMSPPSSSGLGVGRGGKNTARLTAADKLVSSYVPRSEAQRRVCRGTLLLSRGVREWCSKVRLTATTATPPPPVAAEELGTEVAQLGQDVAWLLEGGGVGGGSTMSDLALLRLVVTGPLTEAVVVLLRTLGESCSGDGSASGDGGPATVAGHTSDVVTGLVVALGGVAASAGRACAGVTVGVPGAVSAAVADAVQGQEGPAAGLRAFLAALG